MASWEQIHQHCVDKGWKLNCSYNYYGGNKYIVEEIWAGAGEGTKTPSSWRWYLEINGMPGDEDFWMESHSWENILAKASQVIGLP
jgi:hypothetical protein